MIDVGEIKMNKVKFYSRKRAGGQDKWQKKLMYSLIIYDEVLCNYAPHRYTRIFLL